MHETARGAGVSSYFCGGSDIVDITPHTHNMSSRTSSPRRAATERMGGEDTEAVDEVVEADGDINAKEERLKVVVRVRPLQKKEEPWSDSTEIASDEAVDGGAARQRREREGIPTAPLPSTLRVHENSVTWEKNGQAKMLLADAVFDGNTGQEEIFQSVEDCVDSLLAGFDCSVFAYGQTGTGKTYTMSGLPNKRDADWEDGSEDETFTIFDTYGVVPRCIDKLFRDIESDAAADFSVYGSFVEIYNEKIYDILSADDTAASTPSNRPLLKDRDLRAGWNRPQPSKEAPSLPIRQKLDGTVFVDGLTSRKVESRSEMLRAFREGSLNREVRDNLYNQHSSRGHSVFQITLRKNVDGGEQSQGKKSPRRDAAASAMAGSRLSRLYFVDLAGSEKWHVHGSELTDKYATELSSINKSLSALTSCVLALAHKERGHVPFRDSVLTRLLQRCLQGHGRTAFIVSLSPARESMEESFATLRFAERLRTLRCRPIRRQLVTSERVVGEQRVYYEKQIHSMRLEVTRLRELLKQARRQNQEMADSSAVAANAALVEENRRLKELLMNTERSRLVEKKMSTRAIDHRGVHVAAARQMLSPRPLSEEEAKPSSLDGELPSTPQSAATKIGRRAAKQTDLNASQSTAEEKEYSTLVNRLQDKEARLNWMLEAEMEAQNTKRAGAIAEAATSASINTTDAETPPKKPASTTRSWAVERALQRNLVAVPPPVRPSRPEPTASNTEPTNVMLIRQRNTSAEVKATAAISPSTTLKQDSSRRPMQPGDAAVSNVRSRPAPRSVAKPGNTTSDEVKPSSILKLVGSNTAEKMGKSKDELVDEYKRARRAELEAMLRTMVHR